MKSKYPVTNHSELNHLEHLKKILQTNDVVFLTSGSGVGKTFVTNFILKQNHNVSRPISTTTRKKRSKNEDSYNFITMDEFNHTDFIHKVEFPKHSNNWYGYTKDAIVQPLNQNKKLILILTSDTVEPYKQWFKKNYPDKKIASVFWFVDKDEQTKRYLSRVNIDSFAKLPKYIHNVPINQFIDKLTSVCSQYSVNEKDKNNLLKNYTDNGYIKVPVQLPWEPKKITSFNTEVVKELNTFIQSFPKTNASQQDLILRIANNEKDWEYAQFYDYIIDASTDICKEQNKTIDKSK